MDYPGKVITKTQVTPTQTSASGNWTLDDQAAAIKNNNWPVALVPNPISKSLRFNSADSAYLNRTPASASNRKTWTWSGWVKRTTVNTTGQNLFSTDNGSSTTLGQLFFNDNVFEFNCYASSAYQWRLITTQVWRDLSAWYHIVAVVDTTQATSSNRVKLYVNGTQITAFSTATYPSQNFDGAYNLNQPHYVGAAITSSGYLNGYLTEVNFIDGQALTPSSFGMTNPQTGQWIPLKYSGTYGTNGFYLNFKDATSTTTLGYDYSGNANNWTTNNFSVTAGAGNDSLTDVPTPWFAYNTTGDVGGVFRGNYCTWNPLDKSLTLGLTLSNGNLDAASNTAGYGTVRGTLAVSSGKWYFEVTVTASSGNRHFIGVYGMQDNLSVFPGATANSYGYFGLNGEKYNNSTGAAYGASYTTNDVIGVALDLDNGRIWWSKNGTFQASGNPSAGTNAAYTGLSGTFAPAFGDDQDVQSASVVLNAGQRPFAYTPPTGFRSLCTTNLPATAIGFGLTNQGDDYFNAVLYSGNGTSQTIDTGLQPDFIWIKRRNGAAAHTLTDSVRGISKQLFTNLTDAEQTDADSGVTAISSSSITLGDNNLAVGSVNGSGSTYVAWNWKASGSTVSNTAGTITSTVSANTTAGFSIVTYTGTGTNGATVGHGLGVVPDMIIVKRRNSTGQWATYHRSVGNTGALRLNATSATITDVSFWNNTSPTSTVFTIGVDGDVNTNTGTYVAYCFDAIPGYSAFGSYTGNGSTDGPFVYLGFRARYVLVKNIGATGWWTIYDTARDPANDGDMEILAAQSSSAGGNQLSSPFDIVSNGFKVRSGSTSSDNNSSGVSYIYAAFAESPFQFSNAR